MAKKKSSKASGKKVSTFGEALGFNNIFHNERINFVLGLLLLLIAGYLIWAFVSYLVTGVADQSLIETPRDGEILNEHHEFQNACGSIGAYASWFFIKRCFGLSAFLIPIFLLLLAVNMMRAYKVGLLKWFMCLTIVMIWGSITAAKFLTPFFENACFNPGGDHGLAVCQQIEGLIGTPGLTAILALTAIVFFTYLSMETVIILRKIMNPLHYLKKIPMTINVGGGESEQTDNNVETSRVYDNPETEEVIFDLGNDQKEDDETDNIVDDSYEEPDETTQKTDDTEFVIEETEEEESADGKNLAGNYGDISTPYDPKRDLENYRYPELDLLQQYESDGKPFIDMNEQNANKNRIVDVLRNFGVEISSIKATVGPTITLYEITPAPGVRISRIRNLEDDIALSLSALGIRIIAPIPGKGTIGIEVPNAKPATVSMRSILDSKKFQESTMELPCAVGKTITNEVFMFDLAKTPHLLVAGATGTGKSVAINAIITSLLYKKHPAELKLVMVDPKMVEFAPYKPLLKHYLAAMPETDPEQIVITDCDRVINTLNSLVIEMENRYKLLMDAGVRNLEDYNDKFVRRRLNPNKLVADSLHHQYLPYIVIIIDEYGDFIMQAGKQVETPIARITQKARAVGMHMILATQRPSVNIVTGVIKANIPTRIALRTQSVIDSRTVLDAKGAEQLIGRGDSLYAGNATITRVQCAFVDTPEVDEIVKHISKQQRYTEPYQLPEYVGEGGEGDALAPGSVDMKRLDPMFADVARYVVTKQEGSTSRLQRAFEIGYNRAGKLSDQLEAAGIVGPNKGPKGRDVLITDLDQLDKLLEELGVK